MADPDCRMCSGVDSTKDTNQQHQFRDEIMHQLLEMRRKEKSSTDVVLLCESTAFPVHSVVMAASSRYFKSLLPVNNKQRNYIEIQATTPATLGQILSFIYCGTLEVPKTVDEVRLLLSAANALEVHDLCHKFHLLVGAMLSADNYQQLWDVGDEFHHCLVSTAVLDFVASHFAELSLLPSFVVLSPDRLVALVNHSQVNQMDPEVLQEALNSWIGHNSLDCRERMLHLDAMAKNVVCVNSAEVVGTDRLYYYADAGVRDNIQSGDGAGKCTLTGTKRPNDSLRKLGTALETLDNDLTTNHPKCAVNLLQNLGCEGDVKSVLKKVGLVDSDVDLERLIGADGIQQLVRAIGQDERIVKMLQKQLASDYNSKATLWLEDKANCNDAFSVGARALQEVMGPLVNWRHSVSASASDQLVKPCLAIDSATTKLGDLAQAINQPPSDHQQVVIANMFPVITKVKSNSESSFRPLHPPPSKPASDDVADATSCLLKPMVTVGCQADLFVLEDDHSINDGSNGTFLCHTEGAFKGVGTRRPPFMSPKRNESLVSPNKRKELQMSPVYASLMSPRSSTSSLKSDVLPCCANGLQESQQDQQRCHSLDNHLSWRCENGVIRVTTGVQTSPRIIRLNCRRFLRTMNDSSDEQRNETSNERRFVVPTELYTGLPLQRALSWQRTPRQWESPQAVISNEDVATIGEDTNNVPPTDLDNQLTPEIMDKVRRRLGLQMTKFQKHNTSNEARTTAFRKRTPRSSVLASEDRNQQNLPPLVPRLRLSSLDKVDTASTVNASSFEHDSDSDSDDNDRISVSSGAFPKVMPERAFSGSPNWDRVLGVIGRKKNSDLVLLTFRLDEMKWDCVQEMETFLRPVKYEILDRSACVSHEYTVYLLGGLDKRDECYKTVLSFSLDCPLQTPRLMAPMQVGRHSAGAAVFHDHIFVVGGIAKNGRLLDHVERYSIARDRWRVMPPLPVCGWGMSLVVVGSHLFSIGGRRHSEWTLDCYVYDCRERQWTRVCKTPPEFMSTCAHAVEFGNSIYAFRHYNPSGKRNVAMLNPIVVQWHVPDTLGPPPPKRILAALVFDRKVWVVDTVGRLIRFDPATFRWETDYPFYRTIVQPLYAFVSCRQTRQQQPSSASTTDNNVTPVNQIY